MNHARIVGLSIVTNRDVEFIDHVPANTFSNKYWHTPMKPLTVEPGYGVVFCEDIHALNSPIYFDGETSNPAIVCVILLGGTKDDLDMIEDSTFDVFIEEVAKGSEAQWYREVFNQAKHEAKQKWSHVTKTHTLKKSGSIDPILNHIEELKEKEIIHRYTSLRYSLPQSKRNAVRWNFVGYVSGRITKEAFKEMAGVNPTALEHLAEMDRFIHTHPNYVKGFKALAQLLDDTPDADPKVNPRVIQSIAEEFSIPTFELNYFAVKPASA